MDDDRNHVVDLHDGIKLIPIESDPLAALQEEFADIDEPVDELRDGVREASLNEAGR